MRTSFAIRITAACLLVTMTACATWQPYQVREQSRAKLPSPVRVHLNSDEVVDLWRASIIVVSSGDSVIAGDEGVRGPARRIPLTQVDSAMARQTTTEAKVALGVLVVVGLGVLAWWACSDDTCIDLYGASTAIR